MGDKLATAIAATEKREIPIVQVRIPLSDGQIAAVLVPGNLTPQGALDLIGAIARDVPRELLKVALQASAGMLEVPGGVRVVPPA